MTALREALAAAHETSERLSRVSRDRYQNPYVGLDWPESVDPSTEWFSSPEHLSLYGTPTWDTLDEAARCRLAFHEAANFYSLNIHGEKGLMQGLAERLYRKDLIDVVDYLHHFLDEENKHSIYFGGFCTRYARVYRSRQVAFAHERPRDVADFLFFAKTMIFEEIVDGINVLQGRDERLHPVARFINDNHHREETRHLVFGRLLVTALWENCSPDWGDELVDSLRDELTQFFVASWREYYNTDVYADLGLPDPWATLDEAWTSPVQVQRRRDLSAKVMKFLLDRKILTEEPADAYH